MQTSQEEIVAQIRMARYNATVTALRFVHQNLLVARVRPDRGPVSFEPGQYVVLGLGIWEPDDESATPGDAAAPNETLIKRPYSIACRILDERGRLVRPTDEEELEFYITRVPAHLPGRPALTPRLFRLKEGGRLHVGERAHGRYSLANVQAHHDVLLFATGVGEAPHTAMLAELLARRHVGRIVCATCARWQRDLAYLMVHRELERRYANYRYVALTTREPENVDASHPAYAGKQYLQTWARSGGIEAALGHPLAPDRTQAFLCGNAGMIGAAPRAPANATPASDGMIAALLQLGFQLDRPGQPGNLYVEEY